MQKQRAGLMTVCWIVLLAGGMFISGDATPKTVAGAKEQPYGTEWEPQIKYNERSE
jgi:hypothetical protein